MHKKLFIKHNIVNVNFIILVLLWFKRFFIIVRKKYGTINSKGIVIMIKFMKNLSGFKYPISKIHTIGKTPYA